MRVVLCRISLALLVASLWSNSLSLSLSSPYCPSRNVNVSFQLAEVVSVLCLYLGRGLRGDGKAVWGKEPQVQEKIFYILSDSALLGDYTGFNWRMKESKVVSDISGLGIWQSAVWSPTKSPGLARKC